MLSLFKTSNGTICWSSGQTQVYYNEPTTPLAHWPFRQQTAERPEVSLEVILLGWSRTQVSRPGSVWRPMCVSQLFLARETSLCDAQFLLLMMTLVLIASPRPRQHVTLSYTQSSTRGTVHHNSSDGAISPPCNILPLRLSLLSVLVFKLQYSHKRLFYTAILNCLK